MSTDRNIMEGLELRGQELSFGPKQQPKKREWHPPLAKAKDSIKKKFSPKKDSAARWTRVESKKKLSERK